jgi:hypothetical protein
MEISEAKSLQHANDHLKIGWRLLKVLAARDADGEYAHYIFGWPSTGPAKVPPAPWGAEGMLHKIAERLRKDESGRF